MVLSDSPIKTKEDDLLERTPLAERIAKLVVNHTGEQSYVIGIDAPWGFGKTSFVNLILEQLEETPVRIIKFDPWFFSNQDELIKDFFLEFSRIVKEETSEKRRTKGDTSPISKYVSKLVNKADITISPEVTLFWGFLKIGTSKKFGDKQNLTLRETRLKMEESLQKLPKKILIVVDNLDRLDGEDSLAVFKLVKLTADFPNTVFLLAYDREQVSNRLKLENVDGNEYLKKIIQVPFVLPNPDRQQIWDILFADLNKTLQQIYGSDDLSEVEQKRWSDVFREGFSGLFKTIRDTKRFISSLQLNWSIVDANDINKIDFIAIEAIGLVAPEFYAAMSTNKDLLTGTHPLFVGLSTREDKSTRQKKYDDLLALIPNPATRKAISGICEELFPVLDFNVSHSDGIHTGWWKDNRICASEVFDFYFKLGVPKGATSKSEIFALIKTLKNRENFEENLIKVKKAKRLRNVLSKLSDYVNEFDKKKASTLILSLWDKERELDDSRSGSFDLEDIESQASRIAHMYIRHLPKKDRALFLKELLKKTSGLTYPANLLLGLEQEAEKNHTDALLELGEVKALIKIWAMKARASIKSLTFIGVPQLAFMLYRVKGWVSEKTLESVMETLFQTDEGVGALLCSFRSRVYSSDRNYYRLDKKQLGELYPIEKIEERVKIITDKSFKKLNKEIQDAISQLRNPPTRDW